MDYYLLEIEASLGKAQQDLAKFKTLYRQELLLLESAAREKKQLQIALKGMVEHASCRCGGFEGGVIVAQPCDICQAGQAALDNATANQQRG